MNTSQASDQPCRPAESTGPHAQAQQPRKAWRAPTIERIPFEQTAASFAGVGVDGGSYSSLLG